MAGIYMISAQKPTAVNQSALGHVTSETELNLLIAKNTSLEIYRVTEEGLKFVKQITIWGIIECLKIIRPKHEKKDLILIVTAKLDIMVLACELNPNSSHSYDIVTRVHGNLKDTVSRPAQMHYICSVDPTFSLIAVKCYDAVLKLIPITADSKQLNVTTTRMDDLNVIDLAFLYGYDTPTIGYLCKEPNGKLLFKISEVDYRTKEISQVLCKKEISDVHAFIIPVPEPLNGVVIVGTQSITYFSTANNDQVRIAPTLLSYGEISSYCRIDPNGQRYLLTNVYGHLFMLFLDYDENMQTNQYSINKLHIELLGEISIADNITYIDNGVVFIGSKLGDSQLIKLNEHQTDANKSFINILETYTNLGPIMDMLVVDIEKQGQGQLITCSGANRSGSLRIIRSGIGIHEMANVELHGVKAMWPLKIDSDFDDHLVLSFYDYTKIFAFTGEEFEDIDFNGLDLTCQTLSCSNIQSTDNTHNRNLILQITTKTIRLIDAAQKLLINEWSVNVNEYISVAAISSNNKEILVASRNILIYLRINNKLEVEELKRHKLDYEIACLDINHELNMCAVGLWTDISARLFGLPTLNEVFCEPLGGDIIPRSILIDVLDYIRYLFVSLGDGSVISYVINDSCGLGERRKIVLGTQPTILKKFKTPHTNANNIFACSDRPSVISTNNQKLIYSSVNLKQVDQMCSFNSRTYQNCMALLTENGVLRIGTMDNIQKLHIRTIHLHETPRRLAYQAETHTFGLVTYRTDYLNHMKELKPCRESASTQCQNIQLAHTEFTKATTSNLVGSAGGCPSSTFANDNMHLSEYDQYITHSMLILDQNTFEILHSVKFQLYEYVVSILSISFDSDSAYYVCGTCYVHDDEPEPKIGRLVLFKYMNENNKLVQVCEKEVKGAPYSMCAYANNKLLVSISNTVRLYEFKNDQFSQLAQYSDNVFITHVKCKNDFILVNDVMRSCSVLIYRHETSSFELVARDNMPIWSNASEMLDDENFIISDSFYNVTTLKKDSGQSNEEERKCLQSHACVHIGEQINVFRHGSLGMQQSNELFTQNFQSMVIAGTVSGSIVLFAQLSNNMYKILSELQRRLVQFITTAGKISYDKWRHYETDRRSENSKFFIDGDLIESFLDLSASEANALVKDFKVDSVSINEEFTASYFTKLIEELCRIH